MPDKLKNSVYKIDKWACVLGNICITFNMLIVVFNILMRNGLSKSIAGITDIAGFVSCLIVVLCLPYTESLNGNINVDFIVERFPKMLRKIIYIAMTLFDLLVAGMLSYCFFNYAISSAAAKTTSMNAKLPFTPFLIVCAIGMALFALTIIVKMIVKMVNWEGEKPE
jgi:TRAP-type C4-dicarboxylate transport system permease small subunit